MREIIVVWQILFFGLPLLFLVFGSVGYMENYTLHYVPPTLQNFEDLLNNNIFWNSLAETAKTSFLTAVVAVIIAVIIAPSVVWGISSRLQFFVILLFLIPLITGYAIRIFAWHQIFLENSQFTYFLQTMGLLGDDESLAYTRTALIIVYVSQYVAPVIIYPIVSLLQIRKENILAARNLGATKLIVIRDFIFPSMLTSQAVVFCVVFLLTFGDGLAAPVVGGQSGLTLSMLLNDEYRINAWPNAMALSSVLAFMVGIPLLIILLFGFKKIQAS